MVFAFMTIRQRLRVISWDGLFLLACIDHGYWVVICCAVLIFKLILLCLALRIDSDPAFGLDSCKVVLLASFESDRLEHSTHHLDRPLHVSKTCCTTCAIVWSFRLHIFVAGKVGLGEVWLLSRRPSQSVILVNMLVELSQWCRAARHSHDIF